MKLWLLLPREDLAADDPGEESGAAWLARELSTCRELDGAGEAMIILRSVDKA
jgi:hypothetical protein